MTVNGIEVGFLEIVRYDFEYVDGKPSIVIKQVKVCDLNGNYIKFASLKEVAPYLSQIETHFKPK